MGAGPKETTDKHKLTGARLAAAAQNPPCLFKLTALTASQPDSSAGVPVICSRVRSSRLAESVAGGHMRHLLGFVLKWIQSSLTAG